MRLLFLIVISIFFCSSCGDNDHPNLPPHNQTTAESFDGKTLIRVMAANSHNGIELDIGGLRFILPHREINSAFKSLNIIFPMGKEDVPRLNFRNKPLHEILPEKLQNKGVAKGGLQFTQINEYSGVMWVDRLPVYVTPNGLVFENGTHFEFPKIPSSDIITIKIK